MGSSPEKLTERLRIAAEKDRIRTFASVERKLLLDAASALDEAREERDAAQAKTEKIGDDWAVARQKALDAQHRAEAAEQQVAELREAVEKRHDDAERKAAHDSGLDREQRIVEEGCRVAYEDVLDLLSTPDREGE